MAGFISPARMKPPAKGEGNVQRCFGDHDRRRQFDTGVLPFAMLPGLLVVLRLLKLLLELP